MRTVDGPAALSVRERWVLHYSDSFQRRRFFCHPRRDCKTAKKVANPYHGEETPLPAISPGGVAKAAPERTERPVCRWRSIQGELLPMPADKRPAPSTADRQVIELMRHILRRTKKTWKMPIDLEDVGEAAMMVSR